MRSHFVVKKGHLGRYRFALLGDASRLSGEVRATDSDPAAALRDALNEIGDIAKALQAAVEDMLSEGRGNKRHPFRAAKIRHGRADLPAAEK